MGKPATIETPRSPEREALAEAIARYERAVERVRRVDSLSDVRLVGPALDKLEAAEAVLAKAIAQEGTRTVATILGEQPSGISVEDAEMLVNEAREELKTFERARAALDGERREAEAEVASAERARSNAIQQVVKVEGGMDRLLAQYEEAKREVERQREILAFLSSQMCLPQGWDAIRYYPIAGADAAWRRVFRELERSAFAPLLK